MNLKKIGIIFFLAFFLLPIIKIQAVNSDAGFIPENIWYSKDPFEDEDKIKIYTLIFNPDSKELSGTVNFFDKTIFLGKKSFVVPAKGIKDISIDWTATVGDHTIFGKIENARFLISKDNYEEVYLAKDETQQSKRTVSKKIIAKEISISNDIETKKTEENNQVENITQTIRENIPNFIAKPISIVANTLEGFRENMASISDNKKEEIKTEIKTLEEYIKIVPDKTKELEEKATQTSENKDLKKELVSENKSKIIKPLKYVELFLLNLASIIFNNKILFYGIIFIAIFFVLRFFWKKVF